MQEEKLKGQAVKILLNFTNKLSSTFAYNGFITKERKDFGGDFLLQKWTCLAAYGHFARLILI